MWSDLTGAVILLSYYLVVCALLPTLLKGLLKVPTELVRKIQHVAYSLSIFILLKLFSAWYFALGAAFLLVVVAYPVLLLVERSKFYQRWFVDRTKQGGELRMQLMYVQLMFAILIFLYWGLLGNRWQYIAAVAVMGWGFGDAAAALVGKAFGKRRVLQSILEGAKTIEGTTAMVCTAGAAVFFTLLFYAGLPWYLSLVVSAVAAPVCALVELFSRRGTDTLTVPIATAAVIFPLVWFFHLVGWIA